MAYTEEDFKKMARDPKFMADRWLQRAKASDTEYEKRKGSLSSEEKALKQRMIKAQFDRADEYKKRASKLR